MNTDIADPQTFAPCTYLKASSDKSVTSARHSLAVLLKPAPGNHSGRCLTGEYQHQNLDRSKWLTERKSIHGVCTRFNGGTEVIDRIFPATHE